MWTPPAITTPIPSHIIEDTATPMASPRSGLRVELRSVVTMTMFALGRARGIRRPCEVTQSAQPPKHEGWLEARLGLGRLGRRARQSARGVQHPKLTGGRSGA